MEGQKCFGAKLTDVLYLGAEAHKTFRQGRRGKEIIGLCVRPNSRPRLRRPVCDTCWVWGQLSLRNWGAALKLNIDYSASPAICQYSPLAV